MVADMGDDLKSETAFLRKLFDVAVAAADPAVTIPAALPEKPAGRVVVVGAGKASARMAEVVEQVWGPCEGLVLTRYGYGRPTEVIEIVEASHPVARGRRRPRGCWRCLKAWGRRILCSA